MRLGFKQKYWKNTKRFKPIITDKPSYLKLIHDLNYWDILQQNRNSTAKRIHQEKLEFPNKICVITLSFKIKRQINKSEKSKDWLLNDCLIAWGKNRWLKGF